MVRRKTKSSPLIWLLPLILIVCAGAAFGVSLLLRKEPIAEESNSQETVAETINFIDLQPTVDNWLEKNTSGQVGIFIYDLSTQRLAATYNQDQKFGTASLYKLFVVYEGYVEVEQGILNPDSQLVSGHTIGECLDLAIRESNSTCAETLRNTIGADKIDQLAIEWGMTDTSVSGLSSTPENIDRIMYQYYNHPDLSEETWAKIQDSMLNQPPVYNGLCDGPCDWRRGLPSGFTTAKVYNKVGWEHSGAGDVWNLYHDAAIVEFPETENSPAHKYIVVVMTSKIPLDNIVELGNMIEQAVLTAE